VPSFMLDRGARFKTKTPNWLCPQSHAISLCSNYARERERERERERDFPSENSFAFLQLIWRDENPAWSRSNILYKVFRAGVDRTYHDVTNTVSDLFEILYQRLDRAMQFPSTRFSNTPFVTICYCRGEEWSLERQIWSTIWSIEKTIHRSKMRSAQTDQRAGIWFNKI
jgi:hypothetical protein